MPLVECLVRVVESKASGSLAGTVIVVKPSGHDWTPTELSHTQAGGPWRIVRVDLTDAQIESLLSTITLPDRIVGGFKVTKKRQLRIGGAALTLLQGLGPGVNVLNVSRSNTVRSNLAVIDWNAEDGIV